MSCVVIDDRAFTTLEGLVSGVRDGLMPLIAQDKVEKFTEFHATELYGGRGAFDGVEPEQRFEAIRQLLFCLEFGELPVIYGAVNIDALQEKLYGSADPVDISFRICLKGLQSWIGARAAARAITAASEASEASDQPEKMEAIGLSLVESWLGELIILILDECDGKIKAALQKSFRTLRCGPTVQGGENPLRHFHDDMYFGDSRYSIGIQLADLCSYFIAKHLQGEPDIQGFYGMIEPHIVFSETYPQGEAPNG
jgi:hypothetical protein